PWAARQRLPLNLRSENPEGSVHCTLTGPSSGRARGASGSVTLRVAATAVLAANRTATNRRKRVACLMAILLSARRVCDLGAEPCTTPQGARTGGGRPGPLPWPQSTAAASSNGASAGQT